MTSPNIAIVCDLGAHPWAPIVLGLVEGLRFAAPDWNPVVVPCGGAGATGHAQTAAARLGEAMLRELNPDLVLACVHAQSIDELRRMHDWTREATGAWVGLCFDDPHDHLSTLKLLGKPGGYDQAAPVLEGVLSPEPMAVDWYRYRGIPAATQRAPISRVMHWRRTQAEAEAAPHALAVVAGPWWPPRQRLQPALLTAVEQAGLPVVEVRGTSGPQGRWVSGRDLTAVLHSARLTVDMPRTWVYPENPHQIPCTYTAPRVTIAAACGVPCLTIDPRDSLQRDYPGALSCSLDEAIPRTLELLRGDPAVLHAAAAAAWETFDRRHDPVHRALELVANLRALGFV